MFYVRNAIESDLDDLYELSKQALLLNLPQDKEIIKLKIKESIDSFSSPNKDISKNHFIFCLIDLNANRVIGVSMIHGKHGTQETPHFFLKIGTEERVSETLNKNYLHETLKFGFETNGYSEIGGLVLDQKYRGHPQKLGKILSLSRFLYIAENTHLFTEQIHSELMPPLTEEGSSLLWEAIGRKFFNMEYWEADKLSQTNKEFILNLFPQGTIYTKLLPENVKEAIGKVGPDTLPVKKMLSNIGFHYTNEVDPFDGGPHYRAKKHDITVINKSKHLIVSPTKSLKNTNAISCFINLDDFQFLSVYSMSDDQQAKIEKTIFDKFNITNKNPRTFKI